jgi:predicted SprT family Zn-dependent metalloprotease
MARSSELRPSVEATDRELDELGRVLTREASWLADCLGLENLARKVSVVWNRRMRTAAGRAYYEAGRIELNPELLKLTDVDPVAEIDRTLKHELAHLIAHFRVGGKRIPPHGEEWQQACIELGIPDEARCHSLPLTPRRICRKLVYVCPSCGLEVRRVRKFKRPVACLDCCRKNSGGFYDGRYKLRLARTV